MGFAYFSSILDCRTCRWYSMLLTSDLLSSGCCCCWTGVLRSFSDRTFPDDIATWEFRVRMSMLLLVKGVPCARVPLLLFFVFVPCGFVLYRKCVVRMFERNNRFCCRCVGVIKKRFAGLARLGTACLCMRYASRRNECRWRRGWMFFWAVFDRGVKKLN